MREKALILFGLIAALASAALLLYLSFQIENSRKEISWTNAVYGVGMFNYTNQNGYNIIRFSQALGDYKVATDANERAKHKKQYINAFDILWASIVSLKQLDKMDSTEDFLKIKVQSRQLLNELDSRINKDVNLTDTEISGIIQDLRKLFTLNNKTGNNHFTRYSIYSDKLDAGITRLQSLSQLLIIGFGLTLGSVFFLLWRSMNREQKQAAELKTAHRQLELLVDDLRSGQVEKRAKNQFLAAASHDLRQPLHALGLFLNSLEGSIKDETGHHLLEKIRSSTGALNELLNGVLDISRLDAGVVDIDLSHVFLDDLFEELRAEFSELAQQQKNVFNIEPSACVVYTDKLLLQRILRNLIGNCLIHAPGSTVTLTTTLKQIKQTGSDPSLTVNRDHLQFCDITIADTGPGIPVTQHELVFSEYYQLRNPERDRNKGLGLGLSIVKRLANLLEHELTLSSNTGAGTVFSLSLPLGDASQVITVGKLNPDQSGLLEGLTILVIDDEVDIRSGMEVTLNSAGCHVITSESADMAYQRLVQTKITPDIIIADYRLRDGKTGSEAVELIRAELHNDIPAFLITGDTSPIRVREAVESGIRLLHKPVPPNELFAVIHEVVSDANHSSSVSAN